MKHVRRRRGNLINLTIGGAKKKTININNFAGLSWKWVGVKLFMCFPFSWGKEETHKQNSQEISGKGQDYPGIIPGQSRESSVYVFREVLHGVGADGVGVKFPIFAVSCCCLPLSFRRKKGQMRRKRGKMRKKKGENHSDPIYTNPIKKFCLCVSCLFGFSRP